MASQLLSHLQGETPTDVAVVSCDPELANVFKADNDVTQT